MSGSDTLRFLLDRFRGRETRLLIAPLGEPPLELSVSARREIRRAHEVDHEAPLIHRIFESLEAGDRIFDIGANIGILTLLMARHGDDPERRLLAFEPEPRNHERLRRNVELNGLAGRVTPVRMALGATEGEADLYIRGGPGEGRHSIAARAGSTGTIRVPVTTASAYARDHDQWPHVVKIDVEGAEGQVLAGMDDLIREHPPREIFLEIHPKGDEDRMPAALSSTGAPTPTIDEWLTARGYTLAWSERRRSGEHRHYR